MESSYSLSDYENDNAKFFSKNQEEPFLYKFTDVLYPNPEFLSDSIPDDVSSYRVNLCIFYVDHSCVLPFIKYAVLKNETDGTVGFVEFEKENTASENLESQVTQQLQSLFDSGDNSSADLFSNSYKGFIVKQDDIYMFFDITSLLKSGAQLKQGNVYSVAHELCSLTHIQGNAIGQNVKNMFDKDDDTFPKCAILQPWFYNADGILEMIEVPQVFYICGEDLRALTLDELNRGLNDGTSGTFLTTDCLIDYDDIGLHYYFTDSVEDADASYVRCIVFLMKIQKKRKNMDPANYNSISFALDGAQYWGVKSIDQFVTI